MKKISIIIPCFNAARWIRETLQSAVEQKVEDTEIIVIDDGSTDCSADIVKEDFPSVRLIKTKNQGPSKARNIGTNESSGEFVQYLDADDLLAPGKLKRQLEALKAEGADVAYGYWQKLRKNKDGVFERAEMFKRTLKNGEIDLFTTDFWCPLAAYLFRRSIIEKVGQWNERLPIIQDVRFDLDCALYGGKFILVPELAAYFRVQSEDSVSTRNPIGFLRDCLLNTAEIEKWWRDHGDINAERKKALLRVYEYVARTSFKKDRPTFESAYRALRRLKPGYVPERSIALKAASLLFGYRNAERLSSCYRGIRNFIQRKNGER